jgi:uncharacterized protein (DUF1015 family)
MPKVFPFKAIRPHKDYVARVSARSADFPDNNSLVNEIKSNPYTFHHVTKNHVNYAGAYQEPEKFLPFAAKFLEDLKEEGILLHEEKEAFYYYVQERADGRKFKGIVAMVSVDDYRNNAIKKHEAIRPSRLRFLIELFKTTKVLGEPTVLAHEEHIKINQNSCNEIFSFYSVDGKKHTICRIDNPSEIERLQKAYEQIENFYIADGHHRSAAVNEFNAKFPELTHGYSMSLLMQEDELDIQPFHRMIKPYKPIPTSELLGKLDKFFVIEKLQHDLYKPSKKLEFGLYTDGAWYRLTFNERSSDMDVEVLENTVIKNIYNIQDSRIDSQISFHPYADGPAKLKNLVDDGTYDAAFTLKACSFSEVRHISDLGHTLPAKSTYIEPKLRSGIIIQEF